MAGAWAALLGAIVGGLFALAGSFAVEFRRDRRRQIGAARLVVAELRRADIEVIASTQADPDEEWYEGPHGKLSARAWVAHSAEFVGVLKQEDFDLVDFVTREVEQSGEWGFTPQMAIDLRERIDQAVPIIEPLAKPTWVDRHVWRL